MAEKKNCPKCRVGFMFLYDHHRIGISRECLNCGYVEWEDKPLEDDPQPETVGGRNKYAN